MTQPHHEPDRTFRPRPFRRGFDELPRHWFAGSAVSTQLINAINLLFPAGERFFIRSVRRYEGRIDDPELRRQIRAFYAQEGRHAHAHERYFAAMAAQGYEFAWVLRFIEWLLHRAGQKLLPPALQLSITVALEHYTAIMAELPYEHPYFKQIEPAMRELLLWHAAEEIEHKAVAFDVLRRINPSYGLRMLGFAVATAGLVPIWGAVAASLLAQDRLSLRRLAGEADEMRRQRILTDLIFGRALREYIARDFHPLTRDNYPMVAAYLADFEAAMASGGAA